MEVPYYPVHTQAIERAVKEVTEASAAVNGFERRDGWVRARAENREWMPKITSKPDLVNLIKQTVIKTLQELQNSALQKSLRLSIC